MTEHEDLQPTVNLDRLDLALQSLQRIDEAVDRADSKSEVIATANVGLLTILLGLAAIVGGTDGLRFTSIQAMIIYIGFAFHFGCSALSTYYAVNALFPRLTMTSTSLFYFGAITAYGSRDKALSALQAADITRYETDVHEQVYNNAVIAETKFKRLRLSIWFLYASGLFWMVLMVLLFVFLVLNATA